MMKKFRSDLKSFTDKVVLNKLYYIPLILFAVCAYGFNLVNRTVGVDDLAYKVFGGDIHYAFTQFRWGIYLLEPIIGVDNYTPFIGRFLALLLLILASMMLCFILFLFDKKGKKIWKYTLFSSVFVTYPLINEVWEFNWLSLPINYDGISFFMCLVCIAVIYQIYNKFSLKSVLISGIILTPVMAGYESVVFFYISLVFIILFLRNRENNSNNWFIDGLQFALPLIVGLIGRYVVGYGLIYAYGLQDKIADSAGRIYWMEDPMEAIKGIINNGWYYVVRGLTYFPITEFVFALIVFIVYVANKRIHNKKNYILLGMFLVLSLFFLSFLQGDYLTYRTAQTVQLFVAFVAYLLLEWLEGKKRTYIITIVILLCMCLKQSANLHTLLALNNQRSDNEAYIARTIGYKLYSEFDVSKTVIFCGEYQLGSFIQDQLIVDENSFAGKIESKIRNVIGHQSNRYYDEYVSTNVNSYWNYQMDAFFGQVMLKNYMAYYGFDINVLENLSKEEEDKLKGYYELIAKEEGMKPFEIKDMGDYILVYLGPTIDRVSKLEYK